MNKPEPNLTTKGTKITKPALPQAREKIFVSFVLFVV